MFDKLGTELKIRGFSKRTVDTYMYHNKKFQEFVKREPISVDENDAKGYIAHLMSDLKYSPRSIKLALSSL